jgi:prepilin-type processing-associated H-X9-DG protein/prepilin-type N-terminal cleavage/methylation domain-containing protein
MRLSSLRGSTPFSVRRRRFTGAFTLVELLVTVALIAILVGLALPGLHHARQSLMTTACAQNLSRIGVANALYSGDHDGEIVPRFVPWDAPGVVNGPGGYWYQNLRPYLGLDKNTLGIPTPPFVCPADKTLNFALFQLSCSYAYNYNVVGDPDIPTLGSPLRRRLSQFPHPADVVFAADSAAPAWVDLSPNATPDAKRHPGGAANVLWLDGHVTRLSAANDLGPGSSYYVFAQTQQ